MSFYKNFTGETLNVSAQYPGQRIRVKDIPGLAVTGSRAYMLEPETGGVAFIFRYGAVIFFGMDEKARAEVMEHAILPYLSSPLENALTDGDEALVKVDRDTPDQVAFDYITLQSVTSGRLAIISDILAKSTVLSYYERRAGEIFDLLEPLANSLQKGEYPSGKKSKQYLQHIGMAMAIQRNMTGQVEITDKPDLLWDQPPEINRFYARLEDEYEIIERHTALKEKLDTIHHTAETMVDLLQVRQSLRLEWYIVWLIVFDIVLSLGEKLF